jgi:hypothetical protein
MNRNQRRAAERTAKASHLRQGWSNSKKGETGINSHCKPMCVKEPFRECTACQNPCPHQSNYHRYFVHRFGVAKDNARKKGMYNSVVNSTTGKYLTDADVLMTQMKHFEKDWLERIAIERGFTGSMEELCGILLKVELKYNTPL